MIISLLRKVQRRIFNVYCKYVFGLSLIGNNFESGNFKDEDKRCAMYIITIAYNEENLIRKQIELVKRFIKDVDYHYVIVDNSTKKEKRKLIKNICQENGIEYVPIPRYIDKLISTRWFWFGISHGAALNWMFHKFLIYRKPERFALLDHDIFPIKDCNLTEALGDRDFYGVKRDRGTGWYLWPGYSIFKFDVLSSREVNFLPMMVKGNFLDAGGANYQSLYKDYDIRDVAFAVDKTCRVRNTKGLIDVYHGDCIQIIDTSWLHIINGSNYAHVKGKEKSVAEIVENMEQWFD